MKLFHASTAALSAGQVIAAAYPAIYPDVVAALEPGRPGGCPSRSICLFATDSALHAAAFMTFQLPRSQRAANAFTVYEVEMADSCAGPFALIHHISVKLSRGEPVDLAVAEYWHQTLPWKFLERFGPSFQVLGTAPTPSEILVNNFLINEYPHDTGLAKQF